MISIGYLTKIVGLCIYLGAMGYGLLAIETTPTSHYPPGQWQTIIENRVFTQTLHLDEGDDNTLIINSTFHDIEGSAIMIRNVSNVYIKNCTIHDVKEDGIVLRSTGSTHNVTIEGCTIYNTGLSGILAKQNEEAGVDHTNLVVKNNTLYNIGVTQYDHGMYIFSTDSLIENNVVYGTAGNGISMRSSGIVRGNKVWDTQKSCIRYYSNHAPGASNALYIENNICYQTKAEPGNPGISLLRGDEAPEEWLVENYYIRFNTVVMRTAERFSFAVESPEFDSRHIELYGNLFVNTQDISKTLNPEYVDYISSNYTATSLEGFVNPNESPYDFQLTADSPARYHASTEPHFPPTDINGAMRATGYLDAGAYQFSQPAIEKPVTESQDKPLILTSDQRSENSDTAVTKGQDEPLVQNSAKPSTTQSSGSNNNLLYFMFPVGLLLIIGVIIVFRTKLLAIVGSPPLKNK